MSLLREEFPLLLAVFMAMGAWRISQVRVLTRHASAIETLGATTVMTKRYLNRNPRFMATTLAELDRDQQRVASLLSMVTGGRT